MAFTQLGLNDRLVQGILATGYTAPTAIQASAIPLALEGRDVIGCAQTGTGKTAAFVLPILNHLSKDAERVKDRRIRALVLTPTRELAQQVEDSLKQYGQFLKLRSLSVYGGVSMDKQLKHLRHGIDIVIATPGRLIDHLDRKSIDLSGVEILVLDEADRMFDMGFINDVKKIMSRVPAKRQTLLFSATISPEIRQLAHTVQDNPATVQIGEESKPVESVTQHFYSCPKEMKMDMLLFALERETMDSVLVFSRTKHGADKITKKLERASVKAIAIHSNRTQAQRQRALAGFKQAHYRVLVATDIAARGIDVEGISHVINFDVPTFAEEYVHRIGRTGRAAAVGDAITLVSKDEMKHVKKIEYFIGKKIELKKYPTFNYTPAAHKSEQEEKSVQEAPRHEHARHAEHHPRTQPEKTQRRETERREKPSRPQQQRQGSDGAGRRTPKVQGSTLPRREHGQATGQGGRSSAKGNSQRQNRGGRTSPSTPHFGYSSFGSAGHKGGSGRGTEAVPPVKKRVKPSAAKTESYSTGMYNDSFGSFRHSPSAPSSAKPTVTDTDWKKLIETNESSFRKKLKKIFSRSND
ncbi:MAG: DEAD/DEAH box helicase [Acidobacteriota bacterium]